MIASVKQTLPELALGVLLGLALSACSVTSADEGSGNARFSVWGEEYIEQGIPAAAFADDWSVSFSKFLIAVGDVSVAEAPQGEAARLRGSQLFNLASVGPHLLGEMEGLPARTFNRVSYAVLTAAADTELHSSATQADLELMQEGPYSVYVTGVATRENRAKTFAWGFSESTRYTRCVADIAGREVEGIAVTNGGTEAVELTIHGDHLFYDDLASSEARPRFDAMADADSDLDGEVTLEELRAVRLVSIPVGSYGTGSASGVDDLGAFVLAQTRTLGHFRGEGHCAAEAVSPPASRQ